MKLKRQFHFVTYQSVWYYFYTVWYLSNISSWQIFIAWKSGDFSPTSPERSLKILFDHPRDILIWHLADSPASCPRNASNQSDQTSLEDLKRRIRDIVWSSVGCSETSFYFSVQTYSLDLVWLMQFQIKIPGLLRTQSNFYDGAFCFELITFFLKELHHRNSTGF